jgi:hypothetical protein
MVRMFIDIIKAPSISPEGGGHGEDHVIVLQFFISIFIKNMKASSQSKSPFGGFRGPFPFEHFQHSVRNHKPTHYIQCA